MRLFIPAATVSRASASSDEAGGGAKGELRSASMSHMELGAGCLVRTGLTGGSGSVDAKDANVGADADANVDGGRQRAFGRSKAKAPLSTTTFVGPRIRCVTIMPHR